MSSFENFRRLMEERRAVRVFDGSPVPESVMRDCLELTLLSPSSSNLQPWEFYWIRDPQTRQRMISCFVGQTAVRTASEIVVVVARTQTWDRNRRDVLERLKAQGSLVSPKVLFYYSETAVQLYNQGRFGWRGWCKRLFNAIAGINRAIVRQPTSASDMRIWAVKSTSLACQSLMLAFQAAGYDTCPMEGFDPKRLRSELKLSRDAIPVMGVAIGRRAQNGVVSERVRLDSDRFIKVIETPIS